MIKRQKNNAPASLLDSKWDALKQDALDRKHLHEVDDNCYRECTKKSLLTLYQNKCAFCERIRGYEVNIDHYRPKKPRNYKSNLHFNQHGYYWLCYEWTNLLPLCSKCNQNKSNKFPLTGFPNDNRISTHENPIGIPDVNRFNLAYLNNIENPLLLNPENEQLDFYAHFAFNENGIIVGLTDKARMTIEVLKLDSRDLRRERKKKIMQYVVQIKDELKIYINSNKETVLKDMLLEHGLFGIFRSIKRNCSSSEDFSLLGMYIYKYFNDLILPHISGKKSKNLVERAFAQFKST